ncbi:cytochrome P450 monooxygenase [Amylocystis lapponica]|nr:cytochrome P450 monooxygenase [Amylocystis lapponica]
MASSVGLFSTVLICGIAWLLLRFLRGTGNAALQNIPGPPSQSFWAGNLLQFMDKKGWAFHRHITQDYGPVVKMNGFLNRPMLYVYDPKALHSIVLKDQYVYEEKHSFISTNLLVFGGGLLSTLGDHHRKQRKLLNPVFSVGHMRYMLPIFYRVVDQLRRAIASQVSAGPQEVDVLNWMGRAALELVGQGGLGYSFDKLVEDQPNALGDALKSLMPVLFALDIPLRTSPYFSAIGSATFRRRVLDMMPHKQTQKLKDIVDTMWDAACTIFDAKKSALQAGDEAVMKQIGEGKDIMSILMKANMDASEDDRLSEAELVGQMTTLIFAAMDTTSNSLSRILHILSERPDVQEKLRQEIVTARDGRDLSYDELMQLPFLDAVCRETLRLLPPAPIVLRETRKDIVMPLSEPIRGRDGKLMHEIPIPKDTQVFIGVLGSNCNKALWGEDALEWKPERWLSPLPQAVTDARIPGVYSSLMTFIGGGRACIGFKFSELEMSTHLVLSTFWLLPLIIVCLEAVLCTLLPAFTFEVPKESIVWNISGVNYPTMGSGNQPRMLLKVSGRK